MTGGAAPRDGRVRLGREGEHAAARMLSAAGLRILDRRARLCGAELDLVALDGPVVVFIEVKTRSGCGFGHPAEAVTALKRDRIARAAQAWLQRRSMHDRICRFDVVEVVAGPGSTPTLRHIRDAFRITPTG